MKELLILAAVVCAAIASQAAAFTWKSYTGQYVYEAGSSTKLAGATAYLFDQSVVSQATLVEAILGGGSITDYTSRSQATTTSTGAISATNFDGGTVGSTLNAYFAIVSGDNIFISTSASDVASEVGTGALTFKGLSTPSKAEAIEFTSTASYAGAGWYTSAVPEPTSGLLMLLGMAGLALRRRRA